VRAIALLVRQEASQRGAQVRSVHDDLIEALAAKGADESFGDRVRPRRPDRRQERLDPETASPLDEVAAVDRVPVADQLAGCPSPRSRSDQLPPDPRGGRAGGDVQVQKLAPDVADEREHLQRAERQGLHRQQVGRPDRRL
jgi:hypothetical protein